MPHKPNTHTETHFSCWNKDQENPTVLVDNIFIIGNPDQETKKGMKSACEREDKIWQIINKIEKKKEKQNHVDRLFKISFKPSSIFFCIINLKYSKLNPIILKYSKNLFPYIYAHFCFIKDQ